MPVSLAPVATLRLTRPAPQCDGKMPYSALSFALQKVTLQSSTQKRKMPSPPKPFTARPRTPAPRIRWEASPMHVAPSAPCFAIAILILSTRVLEHDGAGALGHERDAVLVD